MKMVMDERVKHRLIGLAVIISIGAIFAPAIMKKSNQRFENTMSVSVELPHKPLQPDIAMADKKAMFETVPVAHVDIDNPPEIAPDPTLAAAEPLSEETTLASMESNDSATLVVSKIKPPVLARADLKSKSVKVAAKPAPVRKPTVVARKKPLARLPAAKNTNSKNLLLGAKGSYGVQLATFSKQKNADILISRLRSKGYKASYNKVKTDQGLVYKVVVGQVKQMEDAQILKNKLASAVQIRGFVVATGQG